MHNAECAWQKIKDELEFGLGAKKKQKTLYAYFGRRDELKKKKCCEIKKFVNLY